MGHKFRGDCFRLNMDRHECYLTAVNNIPSIDTTYQAADCIRRFFHLYACVRCLRER